MNILDILEENSEIVLIEAVRINNGKEAYSLIRNNKIGAKIDPSYKFNDDDTDKSDSLITLFGKLIKDVGANNAPFAVQLAVNKIPADQLEAAVNNNLIKDIVSYKNKPWAKEIPGYKEAIQLNGKKIDESEWKRLADNLQKESQNHGKANKGSGNLKDVKELYNDGTWSLQVPTSFEGAKAASYFGRKGEEPTPTHWCTRADKRYYDMYSKNSPLYIIRNNSDGKAYQIAFDRINVHFLNQDDTDGDKITKGDLNDIPDRLLKFIKWNGRTLADFKEESNRTELRKGELKNPTTDFKDAEWSAPKDEGNGIVSQVMKNLYNKEDDSNFVTFMIKGKPFKFNKRNNYAKKYYYKNKPNLVLISVLSKNGSIRDDIFWAFKIENGNMIKINNEDFIRLVGDKGELIDKAASEKITADNKRRARSAAKDTFQKNEDFHSRMLPLLGKSIKSQFIEDGLIDEHNGIVVQRDTRIKNVGNGKEGFGNFIPLRISIEFYTNKTYNQLVGKILLGVENMKSHVMDVDGIEFDNELKQLVEKSTDIAIKKYAKEAVKDRYGRNKRMEFREKSKDVVTYDANSSRRLQFENYFPY